jgi:cytochrome c biogenesis protein CcdA
MATRRNSSDKQRQVFQKILQLSMGLFALVYVALGYFVIKLKWLMVPLADNLAYAMGGLLIVYGIFRAYRAYLSIRDTMNN